MGDTVPADVRIFEAMNLACEEAQLTGESVPVDKTTANTMAPGAGVGDRLNMAYATTVVRRGRGRGI
ncbi:hypothetical protein E4U41_005438, partial [Claviceps citrina]